MPKPRADVPAGPAASAAPDVEGDPEVVTGEVWPSGAATTVARRPAGGGVLVARQAAAVAAGSFAAGVATVAAVRVMGATRRGRRARKALPVVATRSFIVDVHLIDPRR
jgi:hypothetical protein